MTIKAKLPPHKYDMGYTFDELWNILGPNRYREFSIWFMGQTGAISEDGTLLVYPWDVERFLDGRPVAD